MRLKLNRRAILGCALLSLLTLITSETFAQNQDSAELGALRSAVLVRLDRTDATNTESSDRGSELVIKDLHKFVDGYAAAVSKLGNGAPEHDVLAAKNYLRDIFALLPDTQTAFERVIQDRSRTAPLLATGLRGVIRRALNVSATRPELRMYALDLLHERMRKHKGLAGGRHGANFLSTFSIWSNEITGWRYQPNAEKQNRAKSSVTSNEYERIVRSEKEYRQGFNAMMCSRLFVPTAR